MCLQGECKPDVKREPSLLLLAPALGPGRAPAASAHMHVHTLRRTAASPHIRCLGLLHAVERRQQVMAGAQQRLSVKPASE